ncbi:hypothetical protein jhhlp_002866 [Lomentospora prolificans]|uniref:Uncharacterized protein n=1 Tax=Lomentospora prolificans TaxID=41688 RepID=A0A2N3NFA5_9PEZI|nr:hypothetical protein jhhlp_002866 [Lomentospora prolificans]
MNALISQQAQYKSLLGRIGRCLCFGCSPTQTAAAAALTSRLTRAWPHAFVSAEGYVRLPIDERRSDKETPRVAVQDEKELEQAAWEASALANEKLLDLLLKVGNTEGPFNVDVEARVTPLKDVKVRPGEALMAFSRFGTGLLAGSTILNRVPLSWKAKNVPGRIVLQSVVFSQASMKPVALVQALVDLRDSEGQGVEEWVEKNSEGLSKLLRELEYSERRGREEVKDVLNAVDALEKDTWDRPDAVEDMGSAKS